MTAPGVGETKTRRTTAPVGGRCGTRTTNRKGMTALAAGAAGGTTLPHRGTLILVLGILSLTLCGLFTGIPAVIMGNNDLKEMDAGRMDPDGRSTTNIGKILGLINLGLTVLVMIGYCGLFIFAMAAGGPKGGR